jgi:hypothetical protein
MPLLLDPPRASRVHDDDLPPEIPFDDDGGWGDDDDDDENDPTRWVTIATFWQPTHAHIARLKLESEDIDCVIIDENLVATDWLYANAVGGIKLQVPEEHAAAARELLHLADRNFAEEVERCPECGSTDFLRERFTSSWSFLIAICVGIVLLFIEPLIGMVILLPPLFLTLDSHQHCEACGHRWRRKRALGPRGFEVVTEPAGHQDDD